LFVDIEQVDSHSWTIP